MPNSPNMTVEQIEELSQWMMGCIWKNDVKGLQRILKVLDPNKTSGAPGLSVSKMLVRHQCTDLLRKFKADESFSRSYDTLKFYTQFFQNNKEYKIKKTLADNTQKIFTLDLDGFPAHSTNLINLYLKSYLTKYKNSNKPCSSIIYALNFASQNFLSNTTFNRKAFYNRIQQRKPTLLNSGWQGDSVNHVIGVMFYQNYIIVGNSLKNKIHIYKSDLSKITQDRINTLLSCPKGINHNELIESMVKYKKPSYSLEVKAQPPGNCQTHSILNTIEGYWFLKEKETGLSYLQAAKNAKNQRHSLVDFIKKTILEKVQADPNLKNQIKVKNKLDNFTQYSWVIGGITFAIGSYLGIAFFTGVFISTVGVIGALIVGSLGFIFSIFRSNYIDSQVKQYQPKSIMTKEEKIALEAGLQAGKSYRGYINAFANATTYLHPSKFYLGLGLSCSNNPKTPIANNKIFR